MSNNSLLEVKNLKKYFPLDRIRTLKAIDDVSFNIKKGKTLGLVGESGCGKTTVGRTILRLYDRTDGEVLFDGIDVHKANRSEYKDLTKRMQIIFQDPYASLNPRFTVRDIIAEGLKIHGLCPTKKDMDEKVYEMLRIVGLNKEHSNRFPHEFSGGQRQRVGIARALVLNPEFIVCDEAISALDVSIQAQIINLLESLQNNLGLTYLFIAHNLSVVRHISDDVAVMYSGNIVEMGETEEVYNNPVHPYTKGLLDATLSSDPEYEKKRSRIVLNGEVQGAFSNIEGCRFCSRCSKAIPECTSKKPLARDLGGGHIVACHNI